MAKETGDRGWSNRERERERELSEVLHILHVIIHRDLK